MSKVILTHHVQTRILQRGVGVHDAKNIAKHGNVVHSSLNGKVVRRALAYNEKLLEVVTKIEGDKIIIITAYYVES